MRFCKFGLEHTTLTTPRGVDASFSHAHHSTYCLVFVQAWGFCNWCFCFDKKNKILYDKSQFIS